MHKKFSTKIFSSAILIGAVLSVISCGGANKGTVQNISDNPSWYVAPKQNNASSLYGVAEGFSLEEATKGALVDAAARLMVSISSESSLLREENQNSTNEEMRQQIKQNVEKIDFASFKVSRSEKIGAKLFVEVEIAKDPFIATQKEKMAFLDRQIADLNKNIAGQNIIQKRNSLIKIVDLAKQAEILSRILESSTGENAGLKQKLATIANAQNQLNQLTDKVEFYFEINSPKEIAAIIRGGLNKEKIKIAKGESDNSNQVKIAIHSKSSTGSVYGAFITKIKIDFENKSAGKVIASNEIEVSGSSTISEAEAYSAAVVEFRDKVEKDGILKILGIL